MVAPVIAADDRDQAALQQQGRVRLDRVGKSFRTSSGDDIRAIADLDLEIRPGELLSILGPSGCGKSTLLRLIAGLDQPSSGSLLLDGQPIDGPHHDRGLVFQDPNLFPWLNVQRNIATGLVARGIYRQRKHEVADYIRLVGLSGFERSYPHQLSGGMAQRVALARALVNHPKALLLDEPLGALDAFTRMRMQDEVLRVWQDRGTTMVLVTHDIDEAVYMSDRILIMTPRPGRVDALLDVGLPRPRQRNSPGFLALRATILEILHFAGSVTGTGNA